MLNLNNLKIKKAMDFGTHTVVVSNWALKESRKGIRKDGEVYVTKPMLSIVLQNSESAEETHNIFLNVQTAIGEDGNPVETIADDSMFIIGNIVRGIAKQIGVYGDIEEVLNAAKVKSFKVNITPWTAQDGRVFKNFSYDLAETIDFFD